MPQLAKPHLLSQISRTKTPRHSLPERKISKKMILSNGAAPPQPQLGVIKRSVAKRISKGGNSYGINIIMRQSSIKEDGDDEDDEEGGSGFEGGFIKSPPIGLERSIQANRTINEESWEGQSEEKIPNRLRRPDSPKKATLSPYLNRKHSSSFNINSLARSNFPSSEMIKTHPQKNEISNFQDLYENLDKFSNAEYLGTHEFKSHLNQASTNRNYSNFKGSEVSIEVENVLSNRAKSHSPTKNLGNQRGYRTLNYRDLLSLNNLSKSNEDANSLSQGSAIRDANNVSQSNHLHEKFISRSGSDSRMGTFHSGTSILINDNDPINEINKNDYSSLDFSVHNSSKDGSKRNKSKRLSHLSHLRGSRRQNSTKAPSDSKHGDEDKDKQKVNKELNTVYIRSSELVNPRRSSQVLGFVVTGRRTKINQYVLVSSIGKGGWGEVFLAVDVNTKDKYVNLYDSRL